MSKEELLALLSKKRGQKIEEEIYGEEIDENEIEPNQSKNNEGETKTTLKKNCSSVIEETKTALKKHHSSVVEIENNTQTTALIKQYKNVHKKPSLFQYVVAFLIVVILLNLYFYGGQRRRLMKPLNINKFDSIRDMLLNNNSY